MYRHEVRHVNQFDQVEITFTALHFYPSSTAGSRPAHPYRGYFLESAFGNIFYPLDFRGILYSVKHRPATGELMVEIHLFELIWAIILVDTQESLRFSP